MQLFKTLHLPKALFLVLGLATSLLTVVLARTKDPLSLPPVPTLLQKRGYDLSLIHFDHNDIIIPIADAAEVLTHFYTQVAIGSSPNGPWSLNQPRISLRFTFGAMQLFMTATDPLTIPWSFVEWHAMQMLEYAQRGYISTYHAYYAPPDGLGRIVVSLSCLAMERLVQMGLGAVGDAVNGAGNGVVDGGTSGAVNGAGSAAGQALNANAKPFNPRRAPHF